MYKRQVVHINSGIAALAAAIIFRKRLGFGSDAGTPHNVPMVVLGAGLLWFGWFGFNAGSSLAADGLAVNAFVVTNTAAAAALVTWVIVSWIQTKKASVTGAATGAVAGLVAITPAAGFVGAMPPVVLCSQLPAITHPSYNNNNSKLPPPPTHNLHLPLAIARPPFSQC